MELLGWVALMSIVSFICGSAMFDRRHEDCAFLLGLYILAVVAAIIVATVIAESFFCPLHGVLSI